MSKDNATTQWSNGAMFGTELRVGLGSSALPADIVKNIENDKNLQNLTEEINM